MNRLKAYRKPVVVSTIATAGGEFNSKLTLRFDGGGSAGDAAEGKHGCCFVAQHSGEFQGEMKLKALQIRNEFENLHNKNDVQKGVKTVNDEDIGSENDFRILSDNTVLNNIRVLGDIPDSYSPKLSKKLTKEKHDNPIVQTIQFTPLYSRHREGGTDGRTGFRRHRHLSRLLDKSTVTKVTLSTPFQTSASSTSSTGTTTSFKSIRQHSVFEDSIDAEKNLEKLSLKLCSKLTRTTRCERKAIRTLAIVLG